MRRRPEPYRGRARDDQRVDADGNGTIDFEFLTMRRAR